MKVSVKQNGNETHSVSEMILGHNLEVGGGVVSSMLTDRLDNPKFCAQYDGSRHNPHSTPLKGVAPMWVVNGYSMAGLNCELTKGMSLSGNESQKVQNYFVDDYARGIMQTGRSVLKDEVLELEIWARVQHNPVTLQVYIGPLCCRKPFYDEAIIIIDSAYWKKYTVKFNCSCNDDEAVFGCYLKNEGIVWFDQIHLRPVEAGNVRLDVVEKLDSLNISTLRFPGGCLSTNYRWEHGLKPLHQRPVLPDSIFQFSQTYDFGTEEYLELCYKLNIRPFITVNVGSGTPEEAGAWAKYCADWFRSKDSELPVIYFHIGNEHYGIWETAHMTGEMYVDTLREYVPLIREGYPNCRIVGLGEEFSGGTIPEKRTKWREPVLDKASDLVDVLAINRYKGQWFDDMLEKQINAAESVHKVENDIVDLIKDIANRKLDIKVAVTEWNYWLHAAHWDGRGFEEPYDAQHGFFVAGMIHMFAKHGKDVEVCNFYHLIEAMGVILPKPTSVQETCIAEIFRFYRKALPGEYLPLTIESPSLGEGKSVDGLCLRTDKKTWLFLANRHSSEKAEVTLKELPCLNGDMEMLCAASPLEQFEKGTVSIKDAKLELPPLSIASIAF